MPRIRTLAVAAALFLVAAVPARADVTGFLGANLSPANRQVLGGALGFGLLAIGFEFEYAFTPEDVTAKAPALKTGAGNLVLQTPVAIMGYQPYFTTGGGFFSETLGTVSNSGFGVNTGGGVKVSLAGPVRLRVDYRVFRLGSGSLNPNTQRIYAGLNLKF